jgi:hypothetical protein
LKKSPAPPLLPTVMEKYDLNFTLVFADNDTKAFQKYTFEIDFQIFHKIYLKVEEL